MIDDLLFISYHSLTTGIEHCLKVNIIILIPYDSLRLLLKYLHFKWFLMIIWNDISVLVQGKNRPLENDRISTALVICWARKSFSWLTNKYTWVHKWCLDCQSLQEKLKGGLQTFFYGVSIVSISNENLIIYA